MYFKLYTGFKSADTFLTVYLNPVLKVLQSRQAIQGFFFIRYLDPDPHLRLRLWVSGSKQYAVIFETMHQSLAACMKEGLLSKVMCDTYYRELERYGQDTMELSEALFCIDSSHILDLLGELKQVEQSEQIRWGISLHLLDDLLVAAGYDIVARCQLLEKVSRSFMAEFKCDKQPYSKQLNDKYRACRSQIEQVMTPGYLSTRLTECLDNRKKELTAVLHRINEKCERGGEVSLDRLLESYMHMTMNRWFRSKNRVYELVIYQFLFRYYKSMLSRQR